jgi:Mn-dependent DtxR family transcriptional regulator
LKQKIFDYMQEHKKPVTSTKMAKYFIASESSVKQALANMVKKDVLIVIPNSKPYLYKLK